ncbi:hypothetical protein WKR88_07475 [Trinickia caryophylli]|uniref:Uncharacterized protein n=1 Tax=Trinickia caryophylli TaxID=28094 RepID=A0A1X7E9D3_TRICW|nr:hypothetical protein [Trinickia caryophylli]PMS13004.1 hypothetical protein C0Z17_06885 [Trinickia caryophylli]TRX14765.1 hypothetical protein FNF07_26370 [Trinickia caryophylli]WQE14612.1 hypothetical protein U0034_28560 [Trinickia caryophylli]SMF29916.1 hypothetical protein SAMN06295900_10587 [Trinickia caryophylli]GLU31972.1 hypothetical protein Busp01_18140 [Trinickia caryophylli]
MTVEQLRALFNKTRSALDAEGYVFVDQKFDLDEYLAQNQRLRKACARYGKVFPDESDPLTFDAESFDIRSFIIGTLGGSKVSDNE